MDVETVEEDDNILGNDEDDESIDDFPLTDEEKDFIAQELAKQKDQTDEEKDFIAQVLAEQDAKKTNGTVLKSAGFGSLEDRNEIDLDDKNVDMDWLLSIDATEDASAPKKRGGVDSSIITVDEKGMDLESRDASIADKGSLFSVKNSSSVAKGADKVGSSSTAAASTESVPAKCNPKLSDEPVKEKPKHITGGGSAGGGATGGVSFGVGADKSPAKKLVTTMNDMMMMDVSTPSKKSSSGSRADNASTMGMGFSAATKTDNVHPEKMDGTAKQSDTLGRAQRRVSFAGTLEVGATEVVDHGKKGRTLTPKKDGDPKKSPANKKARSDHNQKGDSMEVEEEHSSAGAADNTPRANKKNKGVPLTATKKSPVPKRPNNSATPSKATPSKDTRKNLFRALSEAAVAGDNSDNHVSASAAGNTKPPKKPTGSGASIVDSSKSSSGGDVSVVEKAGSSKPSEQPPKPTGSGASIVDGSKSSSGGDVSVAEKAGSSKQSEQPPKTTGSGASGFVSSKSSTASTEKDLSDVPKAGSAKHSEQPPKTTGSEALTQTEGGVTDNSKSARSATAASAGEFSVAEKASAHSVHDDDGNTKSPTAAFQVDVSRGGKSGSEKQRAKFQGPSKHVMGTGPAASDTAGALKGDVLPAAKARTTKKLHASQKQAGDSSDEEGFIPDAVHTTSIQRKEARNKAKQPTLAPQKTTAPAGIDDNMDVDDEMPLKASTDVTEKKCAESRDHIHVDDEESLQSAKASLEAAPKPTKERPASPIVRSHGCGQGGHARIREDFA
ncbi:expressed unknown protein [Seminavis robusta]|uniref:Uncharacterized protein n=1 Tax=Seminavis robusta TaxID=568900 RepID=A0A9N8D735_9STRA|nr:expressed unknown protein [Seminavis robusta]|eukprot:Sro18_g012700.1 n/a (782) ;mRNA; f:19247-21828